MKVLTGHELISLATALGMSARRDGWWQLESSSKVLPDRLEATIEQHRLWDGMVTKSVSREA